MKEVVLDIFGEGHSLTSWQMAARAFVMFFIALLLIRIGGIRIFGKRSSFDDIVTVMFGALLSRGIAGSSPFWASVAAATTLIFAHKIIALLCTHNKSFATLVKGRPVVLYQNGKILYENLTRCSLSKEDLMQSLHKEAQHNNFDKIDKAILEIDGHISFIMKEDEQSAK